MGLFFIYILKASVCLALFYLFYKVLLSKETFHRFNRLALLGILVLSCLLPAVKIAISEPTALNQTVSDLESLLMLAELRAGTEAAPVRMARSNGKHLPDRSFLLLHQEPYRNRADMYRHPQEPERKAGRREHPGTLSEENRPVQLDALHRDTGHRPARRQQGDSGTRASPHPPPALVGPAACPSVHRRAMVQSGGMAGEARIAEHPRIRSRRSRTGIRRQRQGISIVINKESRWLKALLSRQQLKSQFT